MYTLLQSAFLYSARRHFDHLRRRVAGNDLDTALREETCVDARAASDFENAVFGMKRFRQFAPNSSTLCLSDEGRREGLVVSDGDIIEGGAIGVLLGGGHFFKPQPLSFHFGMCGLKSGARLGDAAAQFLKSADFCIWLEFQAIEFHRAA